jgi:hypothetical protein
MVDFAENWFSSFEAPDAVEQPDDEMVAIVCDKNDVHELFHSDRQLERVELNLNLDETILTVRKTSEIGTS